MDEQPGSRQGQQPCEPQSWPGSCTRPFLDMPPIEGQRGPCLWGFPSSRAHACCLWTFSKAPCAQRGKAMARGSPAGQCQASSCCLPGQLLSLRMQKALSSDPPTASHEPRDLGKVVKEDDSRPISWG